MQGHDLLLKPLSRLVPLEMRRVAVEQVMNELPGTGYPKRLNFRHVTAS